MWAATEWILSGLRCAIFSFSFSFFSLSFSFPFFFFVLKSPSVSFSRVKWVGRTTTVGWDSQGHRGFDGEWVREERPELLFPRSINQLTNYFWLIAIDCGQQATRVNGLIFSVSMMNPLFLWSDDGLMHNIFPKNPWMFYYFKPFLFFCFLLFSLLSFFFLSFFFLSFFLFFLFFLKPPLPCSSVDLLDFSEGLTDERCWSVNVLNSYLRCCLWK